MVSDNESYQSEKLKSLLFKYLNDFLLCVFAWFQRGTNKGKTRKPNMIEYTQSQFCRKGFFLMATEWAERQLPSDMA